jgi:hypothetical protein
VSVSAWQQSWRRVIEQVEREARGLDPAKVAITVVSVPFLVIGFALAMVARLGWLLVAFAWSAGLVGWREAGGARGRRKVDPYS